MLVGEQKRDALAARVTAAVQASEMIVDESIVLIETGVSRRSSALVPRCAWCDRYLLAGRWRSASDVPRHMHTVGRDRLTHSICDSCVRDLKSRGASH